MGIFRCHADECDESGDLADMIWCPTCRQPYCFKHVGVPPAAWQTIYSDRKRKHFLRTEALCKRHAAEWYPD